MILAIDIGNSNIACGVFEDENLVTRFRLRTSVVTTPDEYETTFRSILHNRGIDPGMIRTVAVASVVPDLNESFESFIATMFQKAPVFLSVTRETGLSFTIDDPRELGVDLLCNAVAAWNRYQTDCIVVDFGTALTFSMVRADRMFLGVAIAPGVKSGMQALVSNTAQLPHIELLAPPTAIGTNTIHALQSGFVFGYAGLVDSMIDRIRAEMDGPVTVVSTGGYSQSITQHTRQIGFLEPDLTLEGIRILAELQS